MEKWALFGSKSIFPSAPFPFCTFGMTSQWLLAPKLQHVEFIAGIKAAPAKELQKKDLKDLGTWQCGAPCAMALCCALVLLRSALTLGAIRCSRSIFYRSCSPSQWPSNFDESIFLTRWLEWFECAPKGLAASERPAPTPERTPLRHLRGRKPGIQKHSTPVPLLPFALIVRQKCMGPCVLRH